MPLAPPKASLHILDLKKSFVFLFFLQLVATLILINYLKNLIVQVPRNGSMSLMSTPALLSVPKLCKQSKHPSKDWLGNEMGHIWIVKYYSAMQRGFGICDNMNKVGYFMLSEIRQRKKHKHHWRLLWGMASCSAPVGCGLVSKDLHFNPIKYMELTLTSPSLSFLPLIKIEWGQTLHTIGLL